MPDFTASPAAAMAIRRARAVCGHAERSDLDWRRQYGGGLAAQPSWLQPPKLSYTLPWQLPLTCTAIALAAAVSGCRSEVISASIEVVRSLETPLEVAPLRKSAS